jgi:hypothetical protein
LEQIKKVPSSISDSKRRTATRAIVVLLVVLSGYFCALEAVTRMAFPRINHVWRTIQADHLRAVSLRPDAPDKSVTMLIVGNSYLEVGVNRDSLQKEIAPNYSLAYLPMSGTSYLDWYFGLRRLFAEGSHSAIVGVCLSTRDLLSDSTYGGSFANALMLKRDIFKVKQEGHLDNTAMTDYFFANSSSWMGHRGEIHNWLLRKTAPAIDDLAPYFKPKNRPLPPTEEIVAKALPRLRLLDELCRQNGSRFFLLIPPTRDVNDASNELQAAAAREGLLVVLPFQHAELPENAFIDGAHLNPQGAALFTERLGPTLLQSLYRN